MINTTDLQELEISLPGDWLRKDNGDTYSFTTDHMELHDERMFRDLHIRRKDGQPMTLRYALTIEEDDLARGLEAVDRCLARLPVSSAAH